MVKTSEILTNILILCILLFLFVFYKDKILENKYISKLLEIFKLEDTNNIRPSIFNINKESSDNLFATEYEVSETADEAISDALRNVE